jgi:ATP-binding cassette subfamily B protein
LGGIIFTVLATVSFTSVQSFLSKFIVDKIIADKNEQLLGLLFILLLAGYVFHLLCDVFKEFWLARLGVSMQNDVRLLMFGHLQKLPVSYFSNIGKGSLVSRFTNDLAALHTSFLSLVPAIHAILAITVFTVLNAWLHWSFALLTASFP